MENEIWRGSAEIWTADTYNIGLWRASLNIQSAAIQIKTPKKQVSIAVEDIVEVRRYLLPLPSLTLISRDNDRFMLVSFSPTFGGKRLADSIEQSGFKITEVSTWRTGLRASHDCREYDLQTSSKRS